MPRPPHERRVFTYTTAPADYDWFGSSTVRVAGYDKRGRPIRLVTSDPRHAQAQRERYLSGLHMAADDEEWEKLVNYKLVTVNKSQLEENPMSSTPLLVAGALAAGLAWLLLRKKSETKSCVGSDTLGAFGKYMSYDVFSSPGLPNAGSPALVEITKNAKAKLYNEQDCQFHKWTGSSWVVDQATNAELAAFTSKINSLQGVFVGL